MDMPMRVPVGFPCILQVNEQIKTHICFDLTCAASPALSSKIKKKCAFRFVLLLVIYLNIAVFEGLSALRLGK